jgi:hypothetical protein
MTCSEFPDGFTGDMKALHNHHQTQLAAARAQLKSAQEDVERWERLEEASSRLALVAMVKRWSDESRIQNSELDGFVPPNSATPEIGREEEQ